MFFYFIQYCTHTGCIRTQTAIWMCFYNVYVLHVQQDTDFFVVAVVIKTKKSDKGGGSELADQSVTGANCVQWKSSLIDTHFVLNESSYDGS